MFFERKDLDVPIYSGHVPNNEAIGDQPIKHSINI